MTGHAHINRPACLGRTAQWSCSPDIAAMLYGSSKICPLCKTAVLVQQPIPRGYVAIIHVPAAQQAVA